MFKCIGCDKEIGWDGQGIFAYVCPCGATIFYHKEDERLALPYSLAKGLWFGSPLPHLNFLVGESTYTSPKKEELTRELRDKGSIWIEECKQCQKDGTLKRKQDREKHRAVLEAKRLTGGY